MTLFEERSAGRVSDRQDFNSIFGHAVKQTKRKLAEKYDADPRSLGHLWRAQRKLEHPPLYLGKSRVRCRAFRWPSQRLTRVDFLQVSKRAGRVTDLHAPRNFARTASIGLDGARGLQQRLWSSSGQLSTLGDICFSAVIMPRSYHASPLGG